MMPDQPEMSPATKELLKKVRMMVPPMLEKFHKGTSSSHETQKVHPLIN